MNRRDQNCLIHYTSSEEVVSKILRHGFLVVPNRRELADLLIGRENFDDREPQQFGMVSFTEMNRHEASWHSSQFGDFGVGVSWSWAEKHEAQRVIYIDNGPILDAFHWLFQYAVQDLERKCKGDGTGFHIRNKNSALLYSQIYYHLLTLYEYMEPSRHADQLEWRIVEKTPIHHDLSDRKKLIEKLIRFAEHGGGALKIKAEEIEFLVCPKSKVKPLRSILPPEYKEIPIIGIRPRDTLRSRVFSAVRVMEANSRRARIIQQSAPESGGIYLAPDSAGDMFKTPRVIKTCGISLGLDDVRKNSCVQIQGEMQDGRFLDSEFSFDATVELFNYLLQALRHPQCKKHLRDIARDGEENSQR